MLLQSGTGTRPGQLILSSLVLMATGAGLGFLLRPWVAEPLGSLLLGALGLLPWLRVRRRRFQVIDRDWGNGDPRGPFH